MHSFDNKNLNLSFMGELTVVAHLCGTCFDATGVGRWQKSGRRETAEPEDCCVQRD